MAEIVSFKIKLIVKTEIAHEVVQFRFEKPENFHYDAGQFVQFKIPNGEGSALRSYSISSNPNADYLEFCVKILPSGVGSGWLNKLVPGSVAEIGAPKGFFVAKEIGKKYFIATGVGLAPIMAILENSAENGESELLFGVREEKDIFWQNRLKSLKQMNPGFSYAITLSRPSSDWAGKVGRVTEHLTIDLNGHYYICGNVEMVKDVRTHLLSKGLNTKSIHLEIF